MKFTKLLIVLFGLSIILNSCGTFGEAGKILRNEKTASTDEFLVKKRAPLSLPPDFEKIPEPGEFEDKAKNRRGNIEEILKTDQSKSVSSQTKSSSLEESILKQIKK
jgi:hypothetical protein